MGGQGSKVALVTGAGTGMGQASAYRLADDGWIVVGLGRRESVLNEMKEGYTGSGTLQVRSADVAKPEEIGAIVDDVESSLGPIEVVVHSAGINIPNRRMESIIRDDWYKVIDVNLNGAFNVVHAVLPKMRARQKGLFILISSVAGHKPLELAGAAYSASKHGLIALSGVLSDEEAKNNIRSTIISPGEVNTPLLAQRAEPVSDERKAAMLQTEDIADAVGFVAGLPPRAHIPTLIIKPTGQLL